MKKFIAGFLALLMILSSFAYLGVSAEDADVEVTDNAAEAADESGDGEEELSGVPDYTKLKFDSAEAKLATMEKKIDQNGYELYVEKVTGEVGVVDKKSGQILLTNPYDVASSKGTESTKAKILSQLIVNYVDNGTAKTYTSYTDAAQSEQIIIKDIKNGIRVEYTIGREDANYLVPRMIRKDRLEEEILDKVDNKFYKNKIAAFYSLKDPYDESLSEKIISEMKVAYPITNSMAVYILVPDITNRELSQLEGFIKTYCPDYTYEQLEYDHELTQYEAAAQSTPVFKMSLEYTIDSTGLVVKLPANGIRFDETVYKLDSIIMLPYMGAGNCNNDGYTFIPDGSGALMDYAGYNGSNTSISGMIYGKDFAYQTIEGAANQDVMRLPVYGITEAVPENKSYVSGEVAEVVTDELLPEVDETATEETAAEETAVEETAVDETADGEAAAEETEVKTQKRGFLAIIEEGDAMTKITAKHENQLHDFNSVQLSFYPRPKDSYNLADAISVGSATEIEVVSSRKYVGNYAVRFIMLTDDEVAEEKNIDSYYDASWIGMAQAYREYLTRNGVLTKLTDADVKENIPLYLETFGVVQTTEKVFSFPVTVDKPLTTFDNIKTMYNELSEKGITNVDFKLTGFANGGMYSNVPYKLDWESAAGGKQGFESLVAYAKEKGFGVYPDFDFAYVQNTSWFDGLSYSDHIVKTIDNRYASKREYDASLQVFISYYNLCISPSTFTYFYDALSGNYGKYENQSISVSTLGTDLNSDFDSDDSLNREDSKVYTENVLEKISTDYASVMSEGGNAYTLKYVDHLTDVSLDSSRYLYSSASIPFVGVVLHGSKQFAGSAINMSGDVDYALLKAIESGASLYFILSYQNTQLLKEDYRLSQYYSVRYDIWFDELVERYNQLNEVMADLQTSFITGHDFLIGERVPNEAELAQDKIDDAATAEKTREEMYTLAKKQAVMQMRAEYLEGKIGAGMSIDDRIDMTLEDSEGYVYTRYTSDDNTIVLVTYENGTRFILNYNDFEITTVVDGITYSVQPYAFVVIK